MTIAYSALQLRRKKKKREGSKYLLENTLLLFCFLQLPYKIKATENSGFNSYIWREITSPCGLIYLNDNIQKLHFHEVDFFFSFSVYFNAQLLFCIIKINKKNKAKNSIWSLFHILKQMTEFVLALELIKHVSIFVEHVQGNGNIQTFQMKTAHNKINSMTF